MAGEVVSRPADESNAPNGWGPLVEAAVLVMQSRIMTREEYEERRQRLDEELHIGIEMLEAGHRAQVKALDLAWRSEQEGSAVPVPAPQPPPARAAKPVAKPKPSKRRRRVPGELTQAVFGALRELPERFTKDDVCQTLGEEIDRRVLQRALMSLVRARWLAMEEDGRGRHPIVYRRLQMPAAAPAKPAPTGEPPS
jgi:hypothetical protein